MNFGFEKIYSASNGSFGTLILREVSTDCLYLQSTQALYSGYVGGLTVMLDPSTGKPLTYTNWKEKYEKKLV